MVWRGIRERFLFAPGIGKIGMEMEGSGNSQLLASHNHGGLQG